MRTPPLEPDPVGPHPGVFRGGVAGHRGLESGAAFFDHRGPAFDSGPAADGFSLMKWMREDYGDLLQDKPVVLPLDKIRKPL